MKATNVTILTVIIKQPLKFQIPLPAIFVISGYTFIRVTIMSGCQRYKLKLIRPIPVDALLMNEKFGQKQIDRMSIMNKMLQM